MYSVYDGDGELVATFTQWDAAHRWAHVRALEPRVPLPLEIESEPGRRGKPVTWRIGRDRCQRVSARGRARPVACLFAAAADDRCGRGSPAHLR